jgi:hypothetical protein
LRQNIWLVFNYVLVTKCKINARAYKIYRFASNVN